MTPREELAGKIKVMLVTKLRLKMTPEQIGNDQSLFGDGLGLDSIDVLEVVAGLEKEFGVAIQSQEEGQRVLKNVNSIVDFLLERGAPAKK
jgi:acyl carrier protein